MHTITSHKELTEQRQLIKHNEPKCMSVSSHIACLQCKSCLRQCQLQAPSPDTCSQLSAEQLQWETKPFDNCLKQAMMESYQFESQWQVAHCDVLKVLHCQVKFLITLLLVSLLLYYRLSQLSCTKLYKTLRMDHFMQTRSSTQC